MFKLSFHVPATHLETTKAAVFAAGAGRVGHYDECCWQVLGEGQYRPLAGSEPFLGEPHTLHKVDEFRVEMVCAASCIAEAVDALKRAHPYESPSYAVWEIVEF